jgi:citrate lyase subunit beta / citryl-CoA lyase
MKPQRSALTVPGSSSKFIDKAKTLVVDQVILDLEDSVSNNEKTSARALVVKTIKTGGFLSPIAVRINDVRTSVGMEDLEALMVNTPSIETIILPKVENPDDVKRAASILKFSTTELQVQIESALGLAEVNEIAKSSNRLDALIFGPGDFAASLGARLSHIGESSENIDIYAYPLMAILTAARAYGLRAIDGPFSDLHNLDGLRKSAIRSATLGFDGKWAIHPNQIEIINQAFTPTQEEFDKADAIVKSLSESESAGAQLFDGHMIDEATRKMAEATVTRGLAAGLKNSRKG